MRKIFYLIMAVLLWPGPGQADETIRGRYCYPCKGEESRTECRALVKTLALRNAVESLGLFRGDYRPTDDIIQTIASGYLKEIRVIDHSEVDGRICETVEAVVSPETLLGVIEREAAGRARRLEDLGVANNGSLKVLEVTGNKKDRYGLSIEVLVKVLRSTGSLYLASERNKKPSFKICMDFYDSEGMPLGGESAFIHESDVEMIPGELGTLSFSAPSGTVSYRVWLGGQGSMPRKGPGDPHDLAVAHPSGDRIAGAARRRLTGIEHSAHRGQLRVDLLSDRPIGEYRHFLIASPPRLVVDLKGIWEIPDRQRVGVMEEPVRNIRIGKHPDKLRVVMDLTRKISLSTATMLETPGGLAVILERPPDSP